ncbi:hypothetical protein RMR21_018495 [Agrobacterium sp. rho-8.1]
MDRLIPTQDGLLSMATADLSSRVILGQAIIDDDDSVFKDPSYFSVRDGTLVIGGETGQVITGHCNVNRSAIGVCDLSA